MGGKGQLRRKSQAHKAWGIRPKVSPKGAKSGSIGLGDCLGLSGRAGFLLIGFMFVPRITLNGFVRV
jgi:hypothetical protein